MTRLTITNRRASKHRDQITGSKDKEETSNELCILGS